MNGLGVSRVVGMETTSEPKNSGDDLLRRIHEALKLVHSPYSSNDSRKEASVFLEDVKADPSAPYHGFTLAYDRNQEAVVRHYALSLLEFAIKHRWNEYSDVQAKTLRGWILQLSETVSQTDPIFLRNKVAQLWVEIAKRSWMADWDDMDELLLKLWKVSESLVHKEFVLFVLETLSEEIFNGEDTTAALREGVLSKACVEIFTPAVVLADTFPNRQNTTDARFGDEGWLIRLQMLLEQCLTRDVQNNEAYRTCAVKALAVFRSVMTWAIPNAIASSSCVATFCKCLAAPSVPIQMTAIEAMYALYCRSNFTDEEFLTLVCPMYESSTVELLRNLFEWSAVDPHDIDDEKYLLSKKFSEMMSLLGNYLERRMSKVPKDSDIPTLLNLFFAIVRNPSLVVSIPVLVTWTRLLNSTTISNLPVVNQLIAPLLELCSSRLLRYESLPEDSDDPSLSFLLEDIDTTPERHAFLGNYRRYSITVIELIVHRKRSEAIPYILSQVLDSMDHLYDGRPPFSVESYSKTSMPILLVDAQFTVVESGLKGYMKWRATLGSKPQEDELERTTMESNFEAWCERLLAVKFDDPIIRKRVLQLAVVFATTALDWKLSFMFKVLEQLLSNTFPDHPENQSYSDAVKEMQAEIMHELTRLAMQMPDQLMEVFDQLEIKVGEIIAQESLDFKQRVNYQTFLFTIIHRATRIDPELQMQRLTSYIIPVKDLWQNQELDSAVSSFDSFCDMLGFDKGRQYLVSRRVHEIVDWGSYKLDAEGQALQSEMNERVKLLPLRPTKSFLSCSTEKVVKGTSIYDITCAIWQDSVPVILPDLLKFLSHSHAFHNPANWAGLPANMQGIVPRILTDRFWQAGISGGSKDDFYARVSGTRNTLEGLASSIRGSVRAVRETSYAIMLGLSRLGVQFYGLKDLPGPLANSLFADAHCLSSHQLINLLTLIRYLVDDCPVELREHFVPPILATCYAQLDAKIGAEWQKIAQRQEFTSAGDEELTEEMKEESILRQLTHTSVVMVANFLDPARLNPPSGPSTAKEASTYNPTDQDPSRKWPSMRRFCLNSRPILESMLVFLAHAITMRDTRCCGVTVRIFRSICPEFTRPDEMSPSIRELVCTDVLKAAITSLHDPYFVDLQKDLAQLIASIIVVYGPFTDTPRQILLSLPGIKDGAVDKCIDNVSRTGSTQKQQRAFVLELLNDLKGVSISEQGRITKATSAIRKERSKMQQEFMKAGPEDGSKRQNTPDLDGVAGMFQE